MLFEPLELSGAVRVRLELVRDERGFFARLVCADEFRAHGLPSAFVQSSVAWNRRRGTVRGMHFQWPPSREGKLVRCVRGAIHDVLLDLRPAERTYLSYCAVRLDEDNRDAVFVPSGVAHGYQTLSDEAEVLYQMTDFHVPSLQAGVRWNDPAFAIDWPVTEGVVLADRDRNAADFDRGAFEAELARRGGPEG